VKYSNAEYIWDKFMPQVPVVKDTDYYRTYDRDFKIPETKRAPKAVAREHTFEFSLASYALEQHALKDYVGVDEEEQNDQGSLQVDTTEALTDAIYRRMENDLAAMFTTTNWSLNVSLAAAAAFTANTTVSDPVPVFDTGATSIISNSGKTPNVGFIPRTEFVAIKNHVSVLDRVKYTSSEVSKEMIGALVGIPELYVPTAIKDTAAIGLTPSMSNFFSTKCFIGWKPSAPGLKTPSFGYTFISSKPRVRSWMDDERNANAIEVEVKYNHKVVASLTGYLINGAS